MQLQLQLQICIVCILIILITQFDINEIVDKRDIELIIID